jgi:SecD/SecF fusion protein
MPQNYSGRVLVILVVLLGSLAVIFSPVMEKVFHPHEQITQWVKLKPGIEMVGGTSLVYQIKVAPGSRYDPQLATKVAEVLKKRVDPHGLMNLVWRPEGSDRLEIQMSGTGKGGAEAREAQDNLLTAEQKIEQTNASLTEATDAVEQKNGRTRADFDKIAGGSADRLRVLKEMADTFDKTKALAAKPIAERDPLQEAKLRQQYEQLKVDFQATNIDLARLREEMSETGSRAAALTAAKKKAEGFPARTAALDEYAKAFDAYDKVRDQLDDTTDLKRKLRGSGVLEFHILVQRGEASEQVAGMMDRLKPEGTGPGLRGGDEMRWFQIDPNSELAKKQYGITATYRDKIYILAWIDQARSLDHREGQKQWALTEAQPEQSPTGEDVVGFAFDPQGASDFGTLTSNNIGKPLAVVLDGKVISAPSIRSMITSRGTIDGGSEGFSRQELDYLVSTLSAGSLPAQLEDEPISERHVEAELGRTNLVHGLIACAVGVVIVGVFLIGYYYVAGVVAFFAVIMNLLIVLGVMGALQATFTLPSIAGIVLSVGTAVDANVLIFERLREEQHRGLSLRMALRNAYDKARSAILDSNATTFITSLFLIWFGTEEVKGFGITLVIGILASLFTALFVTNTIFGIMIDKFGVRNLNSLPLSMPKLDKALRPHWDWMGKAWIFYTFSVIFIGIGLVLFFVKVHQRQMFDIEFAGGTSVQFDLNHPMSKDELIGVLQSSGKDELKQANPVALGTPVDGNKYTSFDLLTPSTNAVAVRDAVMATLQKDLKLELPSTFEGAGPGGTATPLEEVFGKQVMPVLDDTKWPQGPNGQTFRPDNWGDYKGGVAIVLNHIDPPLTPAQITDRINRQFLQNAGSNGGERRSFTVESPKGAGQATSLAIVLSKDASLTYEAGKDHHQVDEAFSNPLWKTIVEGVDRPAQLKEVRNFDAQVAGDAQSNALLALGLSIAVIMVYIWVRFGNLKYGTATAIALLHDTIFTIAALGFAHYVSDVSLFRHVLQVEPFRINLTVVAGILTIMGYSMIDTIVVFDRIRENRGKYGHVSRQVINDAINQTLSRTLLTAGTTTITVAIMYFMGGPGIHGFTFVLLVGILVGTYSSVAIAAPILLIGNEKEAAQAGTQPATRTRVATGRA